MKITLKINEEDKQFTAPFINCRKLRDTLELSKKIDNGFTLEILDELTQFEVDLYGKQFTTDELLDGFPSGEFFEKVVQDMQKVLGNFNSAVKN
jgi:hypothetical protein